MKRAAAAVLFAALLGCHDNDDEDAAIAAALSKIFPVAESEPNNDAPTADALSSTGAGTGSLAGSGDVDWWWFNATAGTVVQIEVHANRMDQAAWSAAGSVAEIQVFAEDGTTQLRRHQRSLWFFSSLDMDIAGFVVPATGRLNVRLATNTGGAGGDYAIVARVLTMPAFQPEVEANDTFGTATPVVAGAITGHHTDGELDFFSFVVTETTRVEFDILTLRAGIADADTDYYDPLIRLLDTDGSTVLHTNDDFRFYDSGITFVLVTPGTYFLQVSEYSGSTGDADYLVRFDAQAVGALVETEVNDTTGQANPVGYGAMISGALAADDDFFQFVGEAGDMVELRVYDLDNLQAAAANVTPSLIASDGFTVLPSTFDSGPVTVYTPSTAFILRAILTQSGVTFIRLTGAVATSYVLDLRLIKRAGFEQEANNSEFLAGTFNAQGLAAGVIATDADVDYVRFEAEAGELVTVLVYADNYAASGGHFMEDAHGSTLQPWLRIMNPANAPIAESRFTPAAGTNTTEGIVTGMATVQATFVAPAAGTYYAVVTAQNLPTSPTHYYVLERR